MLIFGRITFESYWNESEVITYDILQKAIEFKNGHNEPNDNGGWGNGLPFGNNNELQRYQRDYQDYSTKFNRIRTMYTDMGERKFQDDIPIRIEIDGFLSSVYTLHQLNQDNDNGEPNFDGDFKLWINLENDYVDNFVERYNCIINGFSNENIGEHNNESLQQLLLTMHAPNTALKRYPGGFDRFIEDNQGLHTIIDRLSYLLGYCDDNDSQILRMHNLISNDEYRLNRFNISSVQELVGWCNDEDLPIINERSRRTLDYYL